MSISLTPAAADRVKNFIASRGKGLGLRLGVRKTVGDLVRGDPVDERPERLALRAVRRQGGGAGDVVFEDQGVKVFVDPESLPLVNGTTVDFVKQGLNEAFRFHNPNVKGECGCGESFSV